MGLLITNMLSFKLSPEATGHTKSASLQSTAKGEAIFLKELWYYLSTLERK